MKKVTVKDGQDIYDIALQELGSVDQIMIIYAFNEALFGFITLDAGTVIEIPETESIVAIIEEYRDQGYILPPAPPPVQQTGSGTMLHDQLQNRELPNQHIATSISVNTATLTDKTITDVQKLAKKVDELPASGGIPEAPNNANVYGRGAFGWVIVVTQTAFASAMSAWDDLWATLKGMAFIDDAPNTGLVYGRKSGAWAVTTDPVSTTGTAISFTSPTIYNTHTAPATGNITENLTGARLGVVQKIYHNHSTEPTYPAGWVPIGAPYVPNVLNLLYAEWAGGTRVEYWYTQETAL